jgi:uncharacterized membrane protein (DUF485 family)
VTEKHKLTRAEWQAIEASPEFQHLRRRRRRFIVPAAIFFVVYYFALPVLVGYWPGVMEGAALGPVNWAYLFALSQFFMAWILMWIYVRRARAFDAMAAEIIARVTADVKTAGQSS